MLLMFALVACGTPDYSDGDPIAGADVYAAACQSCHGPDGDAGVQVEGVAAADLRVVTDEQSDDELADAILNGAGTMPAQLLTDTETADCIAYLREAFGG